MREGIRKRRPRTLVSLLASVASVLSFVVIGGITARVAHAQNPGFTEYSLTSGYDRPLAIVTGADKNLWFTELTGANIGTITPSGTVTEFPIPSSGSLGTGGITAGSDGNLWFTDLNSNTVGKITTGGAITEYAALSTANADPESISAGPDGNLWFTEQNANFVGKVTTGGTITEYAITANAGSEQIAAGPDGNVWFAEQSLDKIARVTPGGTVTEFQLTTGAQPDGVVAGPDGNLWIAEAGTGNIDKVSASSGTAGTVLAQYTLLTSGASPQDLTVGSDGNLWATEYGGNALARITTAGVVTEYATGESGNPFGITSGPDGNIWYTEYHGDAVGRFSINPCASLVDSASPSPIGAGAAETIGVTLTSCGVAPLSNATTTTSTTPPSGCPAAPAIPSFTTSSLPFGQTDPHTTTFAAPSCPGTYSVMSQTTVGTTVMATGSATYRVLGAGDSILYPTSPRPRWVTAGSDGNIWSTDQFGCGQFNSGQDLVQLTPTGVATCFEFQPTSLSQLTTGADGNLYVVVGSTKIAQVSPRSPTQLNWEVPIASGQSVIGDLTPGPDGNVWFVTATGSGGTVGFVTPGDHVKQFALPAGSGAPQAITAGSDGALWFGLSGAMMGRVTTTGALTFFTIPGGLSAGCGSNTGGCAALGPDGNVWFTGADPNTGQNYVMNISPAGVVHEYLTLTTNSGAEGITPGADGNLWFNQFELGGLGPCFGGGVGRITPSGVMTDFPSGCNDEHDEFNIVAGPDGNVWNAGYLVGGLAMFEVGAPSTCAPLAAAANPTTVARRAPETIAATIVNCSSTLQLMKLSSRIIPPSACGAPITTTTRVPLQPHVQTLVSDTFSAPRCKGTYTDKLTLSSGGTVIATTSVTYQVT